MIDIVADEMDLAFHVQRAHGLEEDCVASLIVAEDIQQAQAFGRAILQVAHVDVTTSAVEEKTTVARRFVPVALMNVDEAQAPVLENPVAHAGNGAGRTGKIAGQTAVFGFQANDAVHRCMSPFRILLLYNPSSATVSA